MSKTITTMQPTSYIEINRLHQNTLSQAEGVLVVTEPTAGCGGSTLAMLLAQKTAESGKKVLLVDLNLKNAALSAALEQPRKEWRLPTREPSDLLNDLYTKVEQTGNLHLMAAPLDEDTVTFLKDSNRAHLFFTALKRQFERIIVDTTPVAQINRQNVDPVALASAADQTVLSLMANRTTRSQAEKALETLRDAGANVLGVVLNNRFNPSTKDELLNFIGPLRRLLPGLYSWLKFKIQKADI